MLDQFYQLICANGRLWHITNINSIRYTHKFMAYMGSYFYEIVKSPCNILELVDANGIELTVWDIHFVFKHFVEMLW